MSEARAYHHGDLPAALLEAVDGLIREGGVAAVSLRAAARRAGVSHAAPAHHFGDKSGLLTAYAEQGFATLRERLVAAGRRGAAAGQPPLLEMGLEYVRFAVEEPGRFEVMFRPGLIDAAHPGYRQACESAFAVLVEATCAARPDLDPDDPQLMLAATGAWASVHGFATLWLEGNLPQELTALDASAASGAALGAFAALLAPLGAEAVAPARPTPISGRA